jgi:hypothetical protein
MVSFSAVGVAQLVEHQVVALVAAGSSPVTHPINPLFNSKAVVFFTRPLKCGISVAQ